MREPPTAALKPVPGAFAIPDARSRVMACPAPLARSSTPLAPGPAELNNRARPLIGRRSL